jgi:hypothetical protein
VRRRGRGGGGGADNDEDADDTPIPIVSSENFTGDDVDAKRREIATTAQSRRVGGCRSTSSSDVVVPVPLISPTSVAFMEDRAAFPNTARDDDCVRKVALTHDVPVVAAVGSISTMSTSIPIWIDYDDGGRRDGE